MSLIVNLYESRVEVERLWIPSSSQIYMSTYGGAWAGGGSVGASNASHYLVRREASSNASIRRDNSITANSRHDPSTVTLLRHELSITSRQEPVGGSFYRRDYSLTPNREPTAHTATLVLHETPSPPQHQHAPVRVSPHGAPAQRSRPALNGRSKSADEECRHIGKDDDDDSHARVCHSDTYADSAAARAKVEEITNGFAHRHQPVRPLFGNGYICGYDEVAM